MDFGVEVGQEWITGNLIGLAGNIEGFSGGMLKLDKQRTISLATFIIWPKKIIQINTNMTNIISRVDIV